MTRDQQLSDVLSEFARTMVTDFPIQAILDHLVVRIVDVLPVTAVGVTLITPGERPRYVAASDASALRYEELQTELGEGPCVAAYDSGEPIAVADLRCDERFPAFATKAVEAGLVAVFTFPLRQGEVCLGALDLYRDTPGPLDADDIGAAQTLADVAAAYLTNAQARADLRESSERHRESALRDALTGLPNRILFRQRLDHAVLRGRRSGKLVALLFADLDQFKQVNDVHGHQNGDELLVGVAERLTGMLRPGDTLARLSGDEFVVLCEDLGDRSEAEPPAARIGAALAEPFMLSDRSFRSVPASASRSPARATTSGAAPAGRRHGHVPGQTPRRGTPPGGRSGSAPARRAPSHPGAGPARRCSPRWRAGPRLPAHRGHDRRANHRCRGLLRWAHPTRGLLPPSLVVPLAEQARAACQIGRWTLETACQERNRGSAHRPATT